MLIRQIRNATLVIDYAGVRLLTDPWLMDKGTGMLATSPWPENNMRRSPLVDLPCSVEEVVAGVQAVLVTHVHPDHFEADTVWYDEVAKTLERYRPEVTVLNCCGATLASRGRIIMDEEDVLAVCQAAPWTQVVASHLEAVNHGNVSRAYLRTFVDRLGVGEQVLILAVGETLTF